MAEPGPSAPARMGTGPLVGRERELSELTSALDRLASGRGHLFLVSGEPGIGKTRVADELAAAGGLRGLTVARGAAWDGGGAPALWPWIQVLRRLRPTLPLPSDRLRRDLGPLWEAAGDEAAEAGAEELEGQRFRRLDGLRAILAEAAARAPLLVILEDLHAADRASLLATEFVARELRTVRMVLLATHREAEARLDPQLGSLLARIARHGTPLHLGRLGRSEVARMLDDLEPVADRLVDQVHQASGGNPLFVEELLRHIRGGGRPRDIPPGVGAVIGERLARFEGSVRESLEVAAVVGREVEVDLLAELCGLPLPDLRQRLRGPVLTGVLNEMPGGRLGFGHPLFREALVGTLAPARLTALHLRTGELLAGRGHRDTPGLAEAVAGHLLAALPDGDPRPAADWAERAAASASRALAFDAATVFLEGALAALSRLPPDIARQVDVELGLAETLVRAGTGAGARSRAICLRAADRARSLGDSGRLGRAALGYGAELRIGVVDPVLVALLEEALAALGDTDLALRARLLARLAAARQPSPDPNYPIQLAHQALALARRVANDETSLAVVHAAGSALSTFAPPAIRRPISAELVSRALAAGDLVLAQRGYERLSIDDSELGDLHQATLAAGSAARLGEVLGEPWWRWRPALLESMCALAQGRWDDAERAQSAAAEWLGQLGGSELGGAGSLAVHRIGAFRARERGSGLDVLPLVQAAQDTQAPGPALMAVLGRATLQARFNELDAARRVLDGIDEPLASIARFPSALVELADVVVRVGDRDRAQALLPLLEALPWPATGWGGIGYIWQGPVQQWVGGALAVLGRWDEAVRVLEQALAGAELAGALPTVAQLQCELGRALLQRGAPDDGVRALHLLESAAGNARLLGMPHLLVRIERVQAARPVPSARPADAEGPLVFCLAREGEVWSMTSEGRTVHLRHSRGLELLDVLLRNPGREFHVLELGPADPGEAVDTGDAGEVLDAAARDAYRRRMRDLEEELRQAEDWSDAGRGERLRAELEVLHQELARAVGLGGRPRRAGAAAERARVNVQKRLRGVIRRIAEALPAVGRHLEAEVRTGTLVSYRHTP